MTKRKATIGIALFCAVQFAQAVLVDFPQYAFSIEALDAKPDTSVATTALMSFLPMSDGFSPNINVNIQPYPEGMKDYIALSKDQFKGMNWTIISEKQVSENEWNVEYGGPMQGSTLHFYARAVSHGGMVYLVTATAKESQWGAVEKTLRQHVNSFKVK